MTLSEHLSSAQAVAFIEETETAVQLLDEGIRVIESWDGGVDRRIVGLHLMAQGFERLLKLTRSLCQLQQDGRFPKSHEARQWSHRLVELLDGTIGRFEADLDFTARPAIQQDIDFLRSDPHWRRLIGALEEFASGGRYHNLDVMLAGEPGDGWSDTESALFRGDPQWSKLMNDDPVGFGTQWYPYLAQVQVRTLQRAARALTRAWTLGPARDPGSRLTGVIKRFLFLTDDQLSACPPRR